MKKGIAIILTLCLLITSAFSHSNTVYAEEDPDILEYATLEDPSQEELIEDEIYKLLKESISGDYLIDVQAFYESKEAIEEGLYNSKETEYFGFLLSEVDAEFQGTPYVFSVDENGQTIVKEFVPYDDLWEKVLTNVAIGTGVILVCVTVSALTVTAAPAIHLVFACAAEYAAEYGLKSALAMGIKSAILKFVETGDVEESLRNAALEASEGFKWGAIGGAVKGAAAKSLNLAGLKRATKMSMNDIADIQMHSNFSDTTIKNIHSIDEFNVYRDAGLVEYVYDGRTYLLPKDMDWDFVDPATGLTNRQLIKDGYNPVDSSGIKYELHHVGQKKNSPLALLTREQHHDNDSVLHKKKPSEVRPMGDDSFWKKDKEAALEGLSLLLDILF